MRMPIWWLRIWAKISPKMTLIFIENDELDENEIIQGRTVYIARESDILWEAGMKCPCGCKDRIVVQLIPEAKPHWKFSQNTLNVPTLHPSVFKQTGCKAHFWLRDGRISWCR